MYFCSGCLLLCIPKKKMTLSAVYLLRVHSSGLMVKGLAIALTVAFIGADRIKRSVTTTGVKENQTTTEAMRIVLRWVGARTYGMMLSVVLIGLPDLFVKKTVLFDSFDLV